MGQEDHALVALKQLVGRLLHTKGVLVVCLRYGYFPSVVYVFCFLSLCAVVVVLFHASASCRRQFRRECQAQRISASVGPPWGISGWKVLPGSATEGRSGGRQVQEIVGAGEGENTQIIDL